MLRSCPENSTANTAYKISGYFSHTHRAAESNYSNFKAMENIHPSLDGS